jgi:hypothetical protein
MVLVNKQVADEIATLVARHRYAIEDGRDAVKAAEAASAKRNEEIKAEASERHKEVAALTEEARKEPQDKQRNDWRGQRHQESNEISFGDDEEQYEQPQAPVASSATPPPTPPPPPAAAPQPRSAPRRRPGYDDFDDDFENQSWLR